MNTYGDISPRVGTVATKKLLTRGQYKLVLERFGMYDAQGKNRGKVRKWRRYVSLPKASAPLAEGVTPTGKKMYYEDVTATLKQYGDIVELTDVIQDTHEDPVLMEYMDIIGDQAAETVEYLRYMVLRAGTNVFYTGTATVRTGVDTKLALKDFRRVFRFLKKNKASEITRIISPTAKIATEPVGSAYFAVGHTDLAADIMDIAGFVPIEKYSNHMSAFDGEIGKVENIRIILSSFYEPWLEAGGTALTNGVLSNAEAPTGADQADVYPLLVFAQNSYAIVPLQGRGSVVPVVQNPGTSRGGDLLGQRGGVGWKTWQATAILNQSWVCRIEAAATSL